MAITTDDFNKIWASTSPLTPYSFSESNYKDGWNFVGATPPSRQMWDFLQKQNDEKAKYLLDNFADYLPLSGGTLTGALTLSDGGKALSDATVGKYYSASWTATTSSALETPLTDTIFNLPIGVYLVIGKMPILSTSTFSVSFNLVGCSSVLSDVMGSYSGGQSFPAIIVVDNATNSMKLWSGQGSACNFSYLNYGGLSAIRIV